MPYSSEPVIYQLACGTAGYQPHVFQSSQHGPLARDTVSGIVKPAGQLADLPIPVHTHMLRHGTGYYLANRGVDTRTIQSYLGQNNRPPA